MTFATYVLTGEDHQLTADKAFVSLSLFNLLRMPLSFLPIMIVFTVQVQTACGGDGASVVSARLVSSARRSSFGWSDVACCYGCWVVRPDAYTWGVSSPVGIMLGVYCDGRCCAGLCMGAIL